MFQFWSFGRKRTWFQSQDSVELDHQSTIQKLGKLQLWMFSKQHAEKGEEVTQRRNGIVTLCWRHQYPCHAINAGGSAEVRDELNLVSLVCSRPLYSNMRNRWLWTVSVSLPCARLPVTVWECVTHEERRLGGYRTVHAMCLLFRILSVILDFVRPHVHL